MSPSPPFLKHRAGVAIGCTFYMPFINESPFCYVVNLEGERWSRHQLNLIDMNNVHPQITCAAAIGTKIYLLFGSFLNSYTLLSGFIEIDTTNFNTRMITDANDTPPRARHEHSMDIIESRYLVIFGGLCYDSDGENDVFVYDQLDNRWFVPPIGGHEPHLRFGHDLYIYGGAQLDSNASYIYDDLYKLDCRAWIWYKYELPEVRMMYLRNQNPAAGLPQRDYFISTAGVNPYDRLKACMSFYGNKLFIFGGHFIREDEDDNKLLCTHPIDK